MYRQDYENVFKVDKIEKKKEIKEQIHKNLGSEIVSTMGMTFPIFYVTFLQSRIRGHLTRNKKANRMMGEFLCKLSPMDDVRVIVKRYQRKGTY